MSRTRSSLDNAESRRKPRHSCQGSVVRGQGSGFRVQGSAVSGKRSGVSGQASATSPLLWPLPLLFLLSFPKGICCSPASSAVSSSHTAVFAFLVVIPAGNLLFASVLSQPHPPTRGSGREPVLQKMNPQHHTEADRLTAFARLGIVRSHARFKLSPWKNGLHGGKKLFAAALASVLFKTRLTGKGKLAHRGSRSSTQLDALHTHRGLVQRFPRGIGRRCPRRTARCSARWWWSWEVACGRSRPRWRAGRGDGATRS